MPDISHDDQFTIIVRYLKYDSTVDRIITLEIHSHIGLDLKKEFFKFFKTFGINIKNCHR